MMRQGANMPAATAFAQASRVIAVSWFLMRMFVSELIFFALAGLLAIAKLREYLLKKAAEKKSAA